MNKKKIYISGPMTGLPNWNFPSFNRVAQKIRDQGEFEVINPAEYGLVEQTVEDRCFIMAKAMTDICNSDALYMLEGWEDSSGARAEWALGYALGLEIVYE